LNRPKANLPAESALCGLFIADNFEGNNMTDHVANVAMYTNKNGAVGSHIYVYQTAPITWIGVPEI
jgi:hypothetical protein